MVGESDAQERLRTEPLRLPLQERASDLDDAELAPPSTADLRRAMAPGIWEVPQNLDEELKIYSTDGIGPSG